MSSLFVIREKSTGAFCTGQKFRQFAYDIHSAAIFAQRKNAERAIKGMFGARLPRVAQNWTVEELTFYSGSVEEYASSLEQIDQDHAKAYAKLVRETYVERKCEMEVVEVKLTIV